MNTEEVKSLYAEIDSVISKLPNVCRKGCNYCCHQQIEVMSVEKHIVREFILDNFNEEQSTIVKNNLNQWFDYFDANTPNNKVLDGFDLFAHFGLKAAKKGLMCPFLINSECSIYEARPLTCRIHIVDNSPHLCDADKMRNSSPYSMNVRQNVYQHIKSKVPNLTIAPLPYLVNDLLNPERELKPIEEILAP